MDFRCPNCQKDLTVPDEYAGQLMKCPLCQNTFQAPALPPPPPPPKQAVTPAPPPPVPPPPPPAERPRREGPEPLPQPPGGEYTHTLTVSLSPRVVPWIMPAALVGVFVLLFFPWAYWPAGIEREETGKWLIHKDEVSRSAWGMGFGEVNVLTILYDLLFLLTLLAGLAVSALRLSPTPPKLTPGLQQIWSWRAAIVALLAVLSLLFLALQLIVGFHVTIGKLEVPPRFLEASLWVWLAAALHVTALAGALLDFWLEMRGADRPPPRAELRW